MPLESGQFNALRSRLIERQNNNRAVSDVGVKEKPGLFQRIKSKFTKRTEKLGETLTKADPVTGAVATTAAGVGTVVDVATEGAKSLFSFLTPDTVEKTVSDKLAKLGTQFAESDAGQKALTAIGTGVDAWETFKQENPTIATNVESVATIAELFPAFKGAQAGRLFAKRSLKFGKEVAEEGVEKFGKKKVAGQVEKIEETISPKLTKRETELAAEQGRVIRGEKRVGGLLGRRPDEVIQSQKVKKSAQTIQSEIPNASKLDDASLNNALNNKITDTSKKLQPQLKSVEVDKDDAGFIRAEWENIKESQKKDPEFVAFRGGEQAQKNFEAFLDELVKPIKGKTGQFRKKTLDDIWDIRKRYDDSISKTIKQASDNSAPSTQLQKEMWLENRRILNDVMDELSDDLELTSKDAFDKMSDLYLARQNIIGKTKLDLEGTTGVFNLKNLIKLGAGVVGAKFLID